MNWFFDFFDRIRAAYRARRAAKAAVDLQSGSEILAKAQVEAAEMEALTPSTAPAVPVVVVETPPVVAAPAPATSAPASVPTLTN